MPQVYSKIDLYDVKIALKRKGYGIHAANGVALQLNVASKSRFRKTPPRVALREPLRPLFREHLEKILKLSESVDEAVMHCENYSLGKDTAPEETLKQGEGMGMTADEMAHLIDNRVGMQVNKALAPVFQQMEGMMSEMKMLLQGVPLTPDGKAAELGEEEDEDVEDEAEEESSTSLPFNPPEKDRKSQRKSSFARRKTAPKGKKVRKKAKKKGKKKAAKRSKAETEKILDSMGLGDTGNRSEVRDD